MLHTNEQPLRHLFKTLDVSISGPSSFPSPVDSALQHCGEKSIVNYENTLRDQEVPELSQRGVSCFVM